MRRLPILLLLALAWPAFGQDSLELKGDLVTVKVARVVTVYDDRTAVKSFPFTVEAPKGSIRPSWTVPAGVAWTSAGRVLSVTSAPKGDLKISGEWAVIDFDKKEIRDATASITVLVGIDPPAPPEPPKPPTPPAPPLPPTPIPVAGFRVLIVLESSDLNKLPASQVSVLTAKAVKDYLNLRCIAGPDGIKEWRMWDKDVSTANVSKVWQDAMARPRISLPWIVISNGIAGYEGPLPATVTETLELLKKYGGV
jgi:hypothetical protein